MAISLPLYATREDVKSALDSKESARNNMQIDRALDAASRRIEDNCNRVFYPQSETRYFDWPNYQYSRAYRLWLNEDELISVTSLVAGDVTIDAANFILQPVNQGPPYTYIDLDTSTSATFAATASGTWQKAIAITGVFGYRHNHDAAVTTAAEAITSTATQLNVHDSSAVGVGDVFDLDSEHMLCTGKSMLDTGETCTDLTAVQNSVSITGITTGVLKVGETILVDSERMLIVDVATGSTDTITVKRAWDGSILAAHTGSPAVYAPRTLTVTRGALGSTAATHTDGTALNRVRYPGPVRQLCIAYALDQLEQESSGYARTVGAGDASRNASGAALSRLERDVYANYGRRVRTGTV